MSKKKIDGVKQHIYEPFMQHPKVDNLEHNKMRLSIMYRRILTEMSMNRFEWKGMPEEIDIRFLEKTLFNESLAVFFYDVDYDRFMCLRATGYGVPNMYDNPTEFRVYGNSYIAKTLTARECVPIWGNMLRFPDLDIVRIYANRLAEIDTSLDILRRNMRMPFIVASDKNESFSLMNLVRQIQQGAPAIFGTQALGPTVLQEKLSILNTNIPDKALPNLWEDKVKTWNEALTLLGIMNVNSEKRERMVAEEASGSAGQVLAMRSVMLNSRQYAAEQINKMFGLNIEVGWSLDQTGTEKSVFSATDLGELNPYGDIHA